MPTQYDVELGFAINDNVELALSGSPENKKYFKIIQRDTIFYSEDQSAIAAGATDTFSEITNLNPPMNQFYQIYKIMIDGNVQLFLKQPAATNRWGTQRSPQGGYLTDRTSGLLGGQKLNVYMTMDNPPSIQLVNITRVSVTPKIIFFGWRYSVVQIDKPPVGQYTPILVGGLAQ